MALSSRQDINCLKTVTDDLPSISSVDQIAVESSVEKIYSACMGKTRFNDTFPLNKQRHLAYLHKGLKKLSVNFECLDSSRPWLCFWILHSINLLGDSIPKSHQLLIKEFLLSVQHPTGGFCGNVNQLPHLATTYAAVSAVFSLDHEECYELINRENLKRFLLAMHNSDGSFTMHLDGEVDVRGAYCAAVVSTLCSIKSDEMFHNTAQWIAQCQTYEGGFGSRPGTEAHGGYTYCALAALILLGETRCINLPLLLDWACHRQMRFEGGFQGRTNKLVDGCYSFWQGGIFPLIHHILEGEKSTLDRSSWLFHQQALQEFILYCCQCPSGGLVDKPGKSRDFYHSCYCLSGLSLAQHSREKVVVGDAANLIKPTHPVFNVVLENVEKVLVWCASQSKTSGNKIVEND